MKGNLPTIRRPLVCTAPSSPSVSFIHPSSEGSFFMPPRQYDPQLLDPVVSSLWNNSPRPRKLDQCPVVAHVVIVNYLKPLNEGALDHPPEPFPFASPGISARRISHRRVCTGPSGLIPFGWPSGQVSFGWIPIIVPILPQLVARGRDPAASSLLATRPESRVSNMNREYDLFENFPDGSRVWRAAIVGRDAALAKLKELASKSANEVFAMHLPTEEILAKMEGTKDTS